MRHNNRGLGIVAAMAISGLMAGGVGAQTTTDVKKFEIVSVDGSNLVVRGEQGTEQITINDDFHMTVDGRPIAVNDLRPGLRGTARITTTTSTAPGQQSTDVKRGKLVKRHGTSVTAKMPETKTYNDEDLAARNVPVTVEGKPVRMSSLWEGTKLIETTITTAPERVTTERQVDLALTTPPPPARAATPPPAAAPLPEPPPAPPAVAFTPPPETQVARHLPKTASALPTIGLLGMACSAVGLMLTMRRRRRTGEQIG